jgi:hypothetical protein
LLPGGQDTKGGEGINIQGLPAANLRSLDYSQLGGAIESTEHSVKDSNRLKRGGVSGPRKGKN